MPSLTSRQAETFAQWEAAARDLDALEGNDEWKQDTESSDYKPQLVAQRLQDLDNARISCDINLMMYLIRTALSRDLGGMDNVDLYRHSYMGTKKLIESYVESAIATIDAVVTQSRHDSTVEHRDLLEGMLYARQSFGRSALLLSGGGTFGMAHCGVLKSLFQANLLPRIISGASAGSIVCAVMCTRTDEEMPEVMADFAYGDLAVFEEEGKPGGVLQHLRRLLTEGSWSDIKHLKRVMRDLTGDLTFQEAYNRTRRILNIPVSTASVYELPRLLNYVTAPNVLIWSAVAASCSVPLIFNSSQILVKDPVTGEHGPWNPSPQKWIDGSVDNDLPMTRLSEMFNVNHFIVSQVNPHVAPFLAKEDPLSDPRPAKDSSRNDFDWVGTLTTLAKEEALHRLQYLAEMNIFPNLVTKIRSIISQKYFGDITILPEMSLQDLPRLLTNPDLDFMLRACLTGERATWPKLSRIRDRCAIELALDQAVHRLRARVVFSESQQDLRKLRFSFGIPSSLHGQTDLTRGSPANTLPNTGYPRHRRRSGGSTSIYTIQNKRTVLGQDAVDGGDVIDDHEDFLQMPNTCSARKPSSSIAVERPKLRRASRSHLSVTYTQNHLRPVTAPATAEPASRKSLAEPFGTGLARTGEDEERPAFLTPSAGLPDWAPWTMGLTSAKRPAAMWSKHAPSSYIDSANTTHGNSPGVGPNRESNTDGSIGSHSRTSPDVLESRTEDEGGMSGSSDDV